MYASIERQNTLHMHTLDGDVVSAEPLFIKNTLSAPNQHVPRQMCSALESIVTPTSMLRLRQAGRC